MSKFSRLRRANTEQYFSNEKPHHTNVWPTPPEGHRKLWASSWLSPSTNPEKSALLWTLNSETDLDLFNVSNSNFQKKLYCGVSPQKRFYLWQKSRSNFDGFYFCCTRIFRPRKVPNEVNNFFRGVASIQDARGQYSCKNLAMEVCKQICIMFH